MKRILIVDDGAGLLDVTREVLEATGKYHVMVEDSGRRAVIVAATFNPDMLVMDVTMPGMDGAEVACAVRKHSVTRNVRFLFLTSLITREQQNSGRTHVTRDVYLSRPVDPEALCCNVAQLLCAQSA